MVCLTKSYFWNSTELKFQKFDVATVIGLTLAELIVTNFQGSRNRVSSRTGGGRLRLNKGLRRTSLSIGVGLLFEAATQVLFGVPFFCRCLFFHRSELLLADGAYVMEQVVSVIVGKHAPAPDEVLAKHLEGV